MKNNFKKLVMPISRTASLWVCLLSAMAATTQAQTVSKLSITPSSLVGGSSATGSVTLSKKAGTTGEVVVLTSSSAAATVSESVTIPSGKESATFKISTVPVGANTTVSIQAALGTSSKSASLVVKAPTLTALSLSPASVNGGESSKGTLKISSAAPAGGLSINLSSNQSAATVPTAATVPAGATSTTFTVSTTAVSAKTNAKITGTLGSASIGLSLVVNPPALSALSLTPSSIVGGNGSTGTVTLAGNAPAAGLKVSLASSSSLVTVPTSVTVAGGQSSASFSLTSSAVTEKHSVTISAKLGTEIKTTNLTVTAVAPSPFAGDYHGVYLSLPNSLGSVTLTVSATGAISGTALDALAGNTQNITGTVSSDGNATVTTTNQGQSNTNIGSFAFNSTKELVGNFENPNGGTVVTLIAGSKALPFAGTYTGIFSSSSGNSGTVSATVTSLGVITATASQVGGSTLTIKGTVSSSGKVSLKVVNGTATETDKGGAAFDVEGSLVLLVTSTDGKSTTTVTLTKAQP